ncbi:OsmC family protein [Achromobacter aloeverae]
MTKAAHINDIDTAGIKTLAAAVEKDSANGLAGFGVSTRWMGQTKSMATVTSWSLGGRVYQKEFEIHADEPEELLGENKAPNPQELLLAALNACMTVGYVAAAALEGVTLTKLSIDTSGTLDLRGFLGFEGVRPGYESIQYTVTIAGDGTAAQFQRIHETVMATSPNRWNIANAIRLEPKLVVDQSKD